MVSMNRPKMESRPYEFLVHLFHFLCSPTDALQMLDRISDSVDMNLSKLWEIL